MNFNLYLLYLSIKYLLWGNHFSLILVPTYPFLFDSFIFYINRNLSKKKNSIQIINSFIPAKWTNGCMRGPLRSHTTLYHILVTLIGSLYSRSGKTGTLIHSCTHPSPKMTGTSLFGSGNSCCRPSFSSLCIHVQICTFFHNDKTHFLKSSYKVLFCTWFLIFNGFISKFFKQTFSRLLTRHWAFFLRIWSENGSFFGSWLNTC